MIRKYFIVIAFLSLSKLLAGQANSFNIITRDVRNFWEAVDSLQSGKDTIGLFQRLVIDRASGPFNIFIKKWKIKAGDYAYQLRHYPRFYQTLRQQSNELLKSEKLIRELTDHFRELYPSFKAADICIGFGNFSTGGNIEITQSGNLVYIGLEFHGPDSNTFVNELPASIQDYVSRSNFYRTIIHELVHVQQYTHGQKTIQAMNGNLLANRIIREGIPDFISQLIAGPGKEGNYIGYGLQNEKELRRTLKSELWMEGNGNWFGGPDSLFVNRPRDLGYFMGSRIGESYYNNHKEATRNLTPLIEIKNLEKFIRQSRYFEGP